MVMIAVLLNIVFISGALCGIFSEPDQVKLKIGKYGLCRQYVLAKDGVEAHISDKTIDDNRISYSGNVSFNMPPEEFEILAKVDIWKDGAWTEMLTYKEKDPIKLLNTYGGEMWYKVEDATEGLTRGQYPIKPGFYHLENYIVNWDEINELPKPVRRFLLVGKYRAKAWAYYNGKEIACGYGEGELKKK